MRAIRTCIFASLVAACGGGSGDKVDALIIIPDAPPDAAPDAFELVFDFSCMGNSQPAAMANVTLGGAAGEVVANGATPALQASHSAKIDLCDGTSTTCTGNDELDTVTTPASGCPQMGCPFTFDMQATGGSPLDLYVKATKAGNRTSYIYPHAPVTADVANIPAFMFSNTLVAGLALIGINQEAGKGIVLVALTDCTNAPITDTANIVLSIKQNGQAVQGTTELDVSQFAAQLAGTYAIFNVPAGTTQTPNAVTEIGATWKGKPLRAHNVTVFADATTATQLRPGF